MASEQELKKQIEDLKERLTNKETEVGKLLDKVEFLEDNIMKLELLIEDNKAKGDDSEEARCDMIEKYAESKLKLELEEKDKTIRDLKDRLGYLRKEKLTLQRELEKIKRDTSSTSRKITVLERDTTPFDALIKDLQEKINKQQSIIEEQQKRIRSDSEYDKIIKSKEKEIESLNKKIVDLNEYMVKVKQSHEDASDSLLILIERKDKEIESLKKERNFPSLTKEIKILTTELANKEKKIEELETYVFSLKSSQVDASENLLALLERKEKEIETLKNQSITPDLVDKIKKLTKQLEQQQHKISGLDDRHHK